MTKKIIGISGKMGTGKDYLCDLIIRKEGSYHKENFAEDLKRIGADLGMFDLADAYTQEGKQKVIPWLGITIREFLQKFGTDCMRDGMDRDFWVKRLVSKIGPNDHVIIPDMRFLNEFYAVKSSGGTTIRIVRSMFYYDWAKLSGIGDTPIKIFGNTLITKERFIDFLIENSVMLNNKQLKILNGMTHVSETELDGVQHDIEIHHESNLDDHYNVIKHIL